MKWHILFGSVACVLSLSSGAQAQAIPTAARAGTIQVGIGGVIVNPDYAQKDAKGIAFYGDFDFTHHIGIEANVDIASLIAPADIGENTYMIGPRYSHAVNRLNLYAKAMFGIGQIQFQSGSYGQGSSATYGAYGLGGGVDVRATRHINVRALDFEYQRWPGLAPNGLTPYAITIGVAYVLR